MPLVSLVTFLAAFTLSSHPIVTHASSVSSTILVIARDNASANVATSGLNGYGIPFSTLLVPQNGTALPPLNGTTPAGGNYGGIIVASGVGYDYGANRFESALTTDQWNQLYAYQLQYGVRMVQYDVYPGSDYGTAAMGSGCCNNSVEQQIYFTDVSNFPSAGLRTGAGVSTIGLWHYPARITNTTTTKEIAQFSSNGNFTTNTTAAVINNFNGRQQMVFFISIDTTWSPTSNYLQHSWITWMTRGLYTGYRRVNLNTQIDDMFLDTDIYLPSNTSFRVRTQDLDAIVSWLPNIKAKMNSGSDYFMEICHNGNGNIWNATGRPNGDSLCNSGGIELPDIPATSLEYEKPPGSGTNKWPPAPTVYNWTTSCTDLDPLKIWWSNARNRDWFAHISHTFTHEDQDNATYSDIYKEMSFNFAWLNQTGISAAKRFTANGLVPPAITGLHNGDALKAWIDNGITSCVGDNTRPVLVNQQNPMHPYITTVASNGYAGMQVNPRWATRIYFNCYDANCSVTEWIKTSAGSGTFYDLLAEEKADTTRHLLGLHHDSYMFHQANLRQVDVEPVTINGATAKLSLFQAWLETVVPEFVRLVDWPIVTLQHSDMSTSFAARATRDACSSSLTYTTNNNQITKVTLSASENTCSSPIPITFPIAPTSTQGFNTEQIGSDPLTVWVTLSGTPVSFTLSTPVPL